MFLIRLAAFRNHQARLAREAAEKIPCKTTEEIRATVLAERDQIGEQVANLMLTGDRSR